MIEASGCLQFSPLKQHSHLSFMASLERIPQFIASCDALDKVLIYSYKRIHECLFVLLRILVEFCPFIKLSDLRQY